MFQEAPLPDAVASAGSTTGSNPVVLQAGEPEDQPLLAPVTPNLSWAWVHSLTQRPLNTLAPADIESAAVMRRTATIRRGTRMVKLLSTRQLGGFLQGRLISGFCYRAYDLSVLRSTTELSMLTGDSGPHQDICFGLRWRALDPSDYEIPFTTSIGSLPSYAGLADIRPHDRLGPPVLGTGFAPTERHVIPEFVTADLADLPMPANATLVAFTPDGSEITLYVFLPEQRAWTRMVGPQWRHVLGGLSEVSQDQEYLPVVVPPGGASLTGTFRGETYEAVADPPHEYRVLARARAARYPVESLSRRLRYATWRGVAVTIVRAEGDWLRVRLCRPDGDSAPTLGAHCVERGIYEVWAATADVTNVREVEAAYEL